MREFLDEENQGLDALIDYLSFRLLMMRHEQRLLESHTSSEEKLQTGKKAIREDQKVETDPRSSIGSLDNYNKLDNLLEGGRQHVRYFEPRLIVE